MQLEQEVMGQFPAMHVGVQTHSSEHRHVRTVHHHHRHRHHVLNSARAFLQLFVGSAEESDSALPPVGSAEEPEGALLPAVLLQLARADQAPGALGDQLYDVQHRICSPCFTRVLTSLQALAVSVADLLEGGYLEREAMELRRVAPAVPGVCSRDAADTLCLKPLTDLAGAIMPIVMSHGPGPLPDSA